MSSITRGSVESSGFDLRWRRSLGRTLRGSFLRRMCYGPYIIEEVSTMREERGDGKGAECRFKGVRITYDTTVHNFDGRF